MDVIVTPAPPGPSPRARGSQVLNEALESWTGSIPASAGKPAGGARPGWPPWVHPRERGEAGAEGVAEARTAGPSPRARGSPRWTRAAGRGVGSIPASAGKPQLVEAVSHVCGSIPASAGKPDGYLGAVYSDEVHPRERGEARDIVLSLVTFLGPSPRARGSPGHPAGHLHCPGSIPASAGKPPDAAGDAGDRRVHPRERGEASVKHLTKSNIQLSNSNEPGDLTSTAS